MPQPFEKIEHLVILMMENRSFDHYFGSLSLNEGRDVDGLTAAIKPLKDSAEADVPFWDMGAKGMYAGYADPPHGWDDQHAYYANGTNSDFIKQFQAKIKDDGTPKTAPNIPVGYYTRDTLPVLYALADEFSLCDKWFCSLLSSTWPNRKYLYSGKRDADNDTQNIPAFPGFNTTPFLNTLEDCRDPATSDKLTWKCYFSDLPFLSFWYTFAARHAFGNFTSVDNFVNDCRENALPTVSIVDPAFTLTDDHPSYDVRMGQKFIGLIVDALTHSESWNNTALVILYDENGGFYDHVVPPSSFAAQAGVAPEDDPLGFRVPALVISPYAKKGVCSTVFDHTSILKSIAERWQIDFPEEVFGTRWKLAPSIWDTCFNFAQDPRPMGTYTQSQDDLAAGKPNPMASVSWTTGLYEQVTGPVGGVAEFLERIFILPGLKALDQRAQVLDNLAKMEQNVTTIKQK